MDQTNKKIELTKEQQTIINEYCKDDMKKLKDACKPIIIRKGYGKDRIERDDLYELALNVLLRCVQSYDTSKDCKFESFLVGVINKRFYDWTRDNRRSIRCNLEYNPDGTIKKDERGNSIVIPNESLDAENDDGIKLYEKVDSGFSFDDVIEEDDALFTNEKLQRYISELPLMAQKIAILHSKDYSREEILEVLHISSSQYSDAIKIMKQTEFISILY